jgi:hypothetical protein
VALAAPSAALAIRAPGEAPSRAPAAAMAAAGGVAAPAAATPTTTAAPPAIRWKLSGAWSAWALHQRNFTLSDTHPLNDADYVVQNLRLLGKIEGDHVGVVARLDLAQGWWGVDNSPDVGTGLGTDAAGAPVAQTVYNPYTLFRDKDTNYGVHVDWAWLWFDVPRLPVRVSAGRQPFLAGNRLVLDQTYDGVRAETSPLGGVSLALGYAKVHEGAGALRAPTGKLMSDDGEQGDGDLLQLTARWRSDPKARHEVELFGLHYRDRGRETAFLPGGVGYFHSRFQAQISEATVVGVMAKGTIGLAGGLSYNVEADLLTGRDRVANAGHEGNLIDRNDGELLGYNVYAKLDQRVAAGLPLNFGVTLGLGSGDDDPTSGAGNINRIQTMGYFPLTNVWEDSVMPDVEGISPQGLGSPVSRGYRELENTTVAMAHLHAQLRPGLRLETAFAWLQATQPVRGWTKDGPTGETSRDLGVEFDWNLRWQIRPGLSLVGLWGVFWPGDAASLLITGQRGHKGRVFEAKHVLQWAF